MCMLSRFIHVPTLCHTMDHILLGPWESPGKNTGAGCHALLWIFAHYSIIVQSGLGFLDLDFDGETGI